MYIHTYIALYIISVSRRRASPPLEGITAQGGRGGGATVASLARRKTKGRLAAHVSGAARLMGRACTRHS